MASKVTHGEDKTTDENARNKRATRVGRGAMAKYEKERGVVRWLRENSPAYESKLPLSGCGHVLNKNILSGWRENVS